jgi:hypothetical protein
MRHFKLLALVMIIGLLSIASVISVSAQETVLLFDDFTSTTLDTSKWSFSSNSAGAGFSLDGQNLIINSGTTNGGGGVISSLQSFTIPANDILVIEY